LVAENGALTTGKHRSQPPTLQAQPKMADRVDASMNPMEPAAGNPVSELTIGKTQGIELPDRDHAVLARCELRDGGEGPRACGTLFRHLASRTRRAGSIRPDNETSDAKETQK
jgi:hypothetical protein